MYRRFKKINNLAKAFDKQIHCIVSRVNLNIEETPWIEFYLSRDGKHIEIYAYFIPVLLTIIAH